MIDVEERIGGAPSRRFDRMPPAETVDARIPGGLSWLPWCGPREAVGREESSPTISVVIPTLNEEANLPHVLARVPRWISEVIIVDGHSTDASVRVARECWPDCKIVLESRRGKGAALRAGFAAAHGDVIVMLDADGSTDPGEIAAFVGALIAGADFAKGTRFAQGGGTADISVLRRLGNWALTRTVRGLFGGNFSDLCYGYNAFWREHLAVLGLSSDGFEIETEMNLRALRGRLKIVEVPSFEAERIYGVSNLRTFRDGWRVLKTIGREWRVGPKAAATSGTASPTRFSVVQGS